jgi:hypothetical protein
MSFRKDLRRHLRRLLDARAQITWPDPRGGNRSRFVRCRNVCESGLRILCEEAIAPRTFVMVRIPGAGFQGTASVRYCRRCADGWECGLEFCGDLRWRFALPSEPAERQGAPAEG